MPFPGEEGIVADGVEDFGEHGQLGVDGFAEPADAGIPVVVAGEEAGAGGGTDRIGDVGVVEGDALFDEAVEGGGLDGGVTERGDGIEALVVGEEEEDVGTSGGAEGREASQSAQQERTAVQDSHIVYSVPIGSRESTRGGRAWRERQRWLQ